MWPYYGTQKIVWKKKKKPSPVYYLNMDVWNPVNLQE